MADTEKKELEFNDIAFITQADVKEGVIYKEFTVKDARKSKYIKVKYNVGGDTQRYTPGVHIIIKIKYWTKNSNSEDIEGHTQGITVTPSSVTGEQVLRVYSNNIKSIKVEVVGGSLSSLSIFGSKDLATNQIVEVVKADTLYSTVVQSKISWTSSLIVDRIETNLESIVYKGNIAEYKVGEEKETLREYIVLEDRHLRYCESRISLTEFEDLKVVVKGVEEQVYWSAIGDHEDAYKYYTLVKPEEVYPDISTEEAELFKVKAFKTISTLVKREELFTEQTDENNHTGYVPQSVWGVGKDTTGQTDWGKGRLYKALNSFNFVYVDKQNEEIGIKIDDIAPRVTNKSVQGLHNTIILDHEPTNEDINVYNIKENDIIFVV